MWRHRLRGPRCKGLGGGSGAWTTVAGRYHSAPRRQRDERKTTGANKMTKHDTCPDDNSNQDLGVAFIRTSPSGRRLAGFQNRMPTMTQSELVEWAALTILSAVALVLWTMLLTGPRRW